MQKLLITSIVMFITLLSFGQQKTATILINSIATQVVLLPDGTILQELKTMPNYMEDYEPIFETPTKSVTRSVVSNSRAVKNVNRQREIKFKFEDFTLSKEAESLLSGFATEVKNGGKNIVLTANYNPNNAIGEEIALQRLGSSINYLESIGLDAHRILTSAEQSSKATNVILVKIQ